MISFTATSRPEQLVVPCQTTPIPPLPMTAVKPVSRPASRRPVSVASSEARYPGGGNATTYIVNKRDPGAAGWRGLCDLVGDRRLD